MGFVVPLISAVAGLASGGAAIAQAFQKPPKASAPKIATPTVQDKVGRTTNLLNTSPSSLLDDDTSSTGRGRLLGG